MSACFALGETGCGTAPSRVLPPEVKKEDKETAQPAVAEQYIAQISLRALLSWSAGSSALSRTEEGKAMGAAGPVMLIIKQMQLALQKELWDRYTKHVAQLEQITLHMKTAKPTLSFKAVDDSFCMPFVGDVLITKVPGTVYVGSAWGIPFFVSGSAYNTPVSPLFVPAWFAKEVQEDAATSLGQWEVKLFWNVEKRHFVKQYTWTSDVKVFTFHIPVLKAVHYGVAHRDI